MSCDEKKYELPRFLHPLADKPWLKNNSRRLFWVWVGYQAVKGTLTTSLIWVPLLLHYLHIR